MTTNTITFNVFSQGGSFSKPVLKFEQTRVVPEANFLAIKADLEAKGWVIKQVPQEVLDRVNGVAA